MSDLLISRTQLVSIPPDIQEEHKKVWKYVESFEQRYEKIASPDDIINEITDDLDLVCDTYQLPRDLSDTICRIDNYDIFDAVSNNMDDTIESEYQKKYLHYLLGQLSKRERIILINYFGLEGA